MMNGVKLICFYGPESTGKSTLAKRMAEIYKTDYVPEVAREMITSNDFSLTDIIYIGHAQTAMVLKKIQSANKILFCDTDLITTQIYAKEYLGEVPEVLMVLEKSIPYDHYFLFDIDVPWIADGLRDLGHKRQEMYRIFKSELDKRKIPYTNVRGNYLQREIFLTNQMNHLFNFPDL